MPYQYKREPLNDDEVNKLTNAYDTFEKKFCCWILLDIDLRVSELAKLKKTQLLGHDRLATTELYLNPSPEDAIREFLGKW